MYIEKRFIKILISKEYEIIEEMVLLYEAPDDKEKVVIKVNICGEKFNCKSDNFFLGLQALRKKLEIKNIQIICNGTAENVYSTPIQMSKEYGRKAYKLYAGKLAETKDIVDIFECDEKLNFVSVDKQIQFYQKWTKTLN